MNAAEIARALDTATDSARLGAGALPASAYGRVPNGLATLPDS